MTNVPRKVRAAQQAAAPGGARAGRSNVLAASIGAGRG